MVADQPWRRRAEGGVAGSVATGAAEHTAGDRQWGMGDEGRDGRRAAVVVGAKPRLAGCG